MDSATFLAARNEVHHAIQVVSAWGATHLPADDGHSYANLGWDSKLDALVSRRAHGLTAGLRVRTMTWALLRGSQVLAERGVVGSTLAEGLAWLRAAGTEAGAPDTALTPVTYDLPDHPVASGAVFTELDPEALVTLAMWFDHANTHLSALAAHEPDASEVRCWPHHFDLATLITLDRDAPDPEHARSVGVGMTPGDAGIGEPYFYVTPWPPPAARVGPRLHAGHWHSEGWFGAVLTRSEWDLQAESLDSFLTESVAAARELAGA